MANINWDSFFWRNVKRGSLESVGWYYDGWKNKGFLGIKGSGTAQRQGLYKAFRRGGMDTIEAKAALSKTTQTQYKMLRRRGLTPEGARKLISSSTGRAVAAGVFGLALTAYSIYEGYQEHGFGGAVGAATEMGALGIGISMAKDALYNPAGAIVGGLAIAGAVTYGVNKYGEARQRRIKGLEFAAVNSNIVDSQGAYTERQRAINALNDSRINARIALGNEAALLHTR